jgi:hypothetical protein
MDQSAKEQVRMAFHCSLLPVREFDDALVLPTGTVLRKKTWQVLRVDPYLDGVSAMLELNAGAVARKQILHGIRTLGHDPGIAAVEHDPEPEDAASVTGKATVSQVQPKEIRVRARQAVEVMDRSATRLA